MIDIYFDRDEENGSLSVNIATDRLNLDSMNKNREEDYRQYWDILSDARVMEKVGTGNPWCDESIRLRLKGWEDSWFNGIPFSAFNVRNNDTDECMGIVILENRGTPSQAELGYVFDSRWWGKGYGTEAVTPVVNDYAHQLKSRGYKVNKVPFSSIAAEARVDNPASCSILRRAGMQCVGEKQKYGKQLHQFFKALEDPVVHTFEASINVIKT